MFLFFLLNLLRQYEDRELRVARERDRKRLEFTNQLQRINNQLEYERSRDTEGLFYPITYFGDLLLFCLVRIVSICI